jgi:DNA-binding PadR family transcriptional regulator
MHVEGTHDPRPAGDPPPGNARAGTASRSLSDTAFVVLGYVGTRSSGVHGYELHRHLSSSVHRIASLRLSHMYRLLHQLERVGFVTRSIDAASSRLRHPYATTRAGRAAFSDWLLSAPQDVDPLRDPLVDRLRFADRLPRPSLLHLLDNAAHRCRVELDALGRLGAAAEAPGDAEAEADSVYVVALREHLERQARLIEKLRDVARRHPQRAPVHPAAGRRPCVSRWRPPP